MKEKRERLHFPEIRPEKVQFGCLAVLGIMELALVAFGPMEFWLSSFVAENFLVIPGVLFLGAALTLDRSPLAKRRLFAGAACVLWLMIAQCAQRMAWEEPDHISMLWTVYLLAFPYAAAAKEKKKGLQFMAGVTVLISMLLTLYALLMVLKILPVSDQFHWDGARLWALWHPNITACIFMMGIALCLAFCFRAEKTWSKALLIAGAAMQFGALALTNCRTSILMTCALMAGVVFFLVFRGGWKRFLLAGLAALVLFGGLFLSSDTLYEAHHDRLLTQYAAQQESVPGENGTGEAPALPTHNGQGSLLSDLKTLNGRTPIWRCGLRAVWWQPSLMARGTARVGDAISAVEGIPFKVEHGHNSWMQMLVGFGLPGLLFALYFTFLAVRGAVFLLLKLNSSMWQKCMALLVLCLLMAGFLEPFLFAEFMGHYHFINVMFFFCTGYVDLWREESLHPERV